MGDTVVFAVTIFDGKEESRFHIRCAVVPQPNDEDWPDDLRKRNHKTITLKQTVNSKLSRVQTQLSWRSVFVTVDRLDADYHLLGTSDFVLPKELFERGLYKSLRFLEGRGALRTSAPLETVDEELVQNLGVMANTLFAYQYMLARRGIRSLANLVIRKVVRPNPLLLVSTKGFSLGTGEVERFASLASLPDGCTDAFTLTGVKVGLRTHFGTKEMLTADITAVPLLSPFHMTGGVVLIEGKPITKSNRRFRMRLISARRGNGPKVRVHVRRRAESALWPISGAIPAGWFRHDP